MPSSATCNKADLRPKAGRSTPDPAPQCTEGPHTLAWGDTVPSGARPAAAVSSCATAAAPAAATAGLPSRSASPSCSAHCSGRGAVKACQHSTSSRRRNKRHSDILYKFHSSHFTYCTHVTCPHYTVNALSTSQPRRGGWDHRLDSRHRGAWWHPRGDIRWTEML